MELGLQTIHYLGGALKDFFLGPGKIGKIVKCIFLGWFWRLGWVGWGLGVGFGLGWVWGRVRMGVGGVGWGSGEGIWGFGVGNGVPSILSM